MEIINMPIGELIPYEKNPRRNDKAVKPVMESLKEFGWKQPIVIDKNNVIIAGHTRLRAAKRLKMQTVPCVRADDLTPEQVKAFRLADNKTAEFATWDMDLLNSELLDIPTIDMTSFGFDAPEPEPEEDGFDVDKAAEEAKQNPVTKPGTLYQLGNHRLLCGDSTNRSDVLRLLGGQMVDMVFTDPPYNVAYEGNALRASRENVFRQEIKNDAMGETKFKNFLDAVFDNYFAVMKPGAPYYVCYASRSAIEFRQAVTDAGLLFKQELIWCKQRFVLSMQDYNWQHEPILYGWKPGAKHHFYGTKKLSTVIPEDFPVEIGQDADGHQLIHINVGLKTVVLRADNIKAVNMEEVNSVLHVPAPVKSKLHPTMKPIALCSKCIKNSCQQGDSVLDLFGGSGSTLIACEQINRQCYSMELDPVYCDVIVKRWEALTGRKAEVIGGA